MSITIPVTVPSGQIPLGFYVDETTGKLEGIPVKSYTSTSVTLLTRHFLPDSKLKSGDLTAKSGTGTSANIIISSIAESVLNGQPIISSGFKPGTDDWEFVNYGSYTAYGGHCAGQTMGAMWYYFEKKPTDGSLFNKFSDNAKLWEDDAKGYKFCSVLQNDLDFNGAVSTIFDKYIDKNQELDKFKLLTIAGAIMVTGEPQAIAIYMLTGKLNPDGSPEYAGHAVICYQVSVSGGKLYISDPNYPGTNQSIDFANNKFKPYMAKLNGNNASDAAYPYITYYAKTAVIDWDKIGKRYDEMINNTIGTVAPNTFPAYTIWVSDKTKDYELKDGMTVTKDTLTTYVECPTATEYYTSNGKKLISSRIYNIDGTVRSVQTGVSITNWALRASEYVKLTPGPNKLGYYVIGWNKNALYENSTSRIPLFVDFKWITVNYVTLGVAADPAKGEPAKEVKFYALTKGSAPKSAKYVWDFGDGTAAVTKTNDSTAVHTYAKIGNYTIKTELYDNSTNTKITDTSVSYVVAIVSTTTPFSGTYQFPSTKYSNIFTFKVEVTGVFDSQSYTVKNVEVGDRYITINVDKNTSISKPDFKLTFSYKVSVVSATNRIDQPTYVLNNNLNISSIQYSAYSLNNTNSLSQEYPTASGVFSLAPVYPNYALANIITRFSYDYNEVYTYKNPVTTQTIKYYVETDMGSLQIYQSNNW